jgi:HD-GYP domain-containing protein (c-di-GMP phosphodiesterase class II)
MIKKVKVDQLIPGVFVHDFNCGWRSDNLIINQTRVKDTKIIDILHSWGIREVYIDTDRGLDVEDARPAAEVRRETDEALHRLAEAQPATTRFIPLDEEITMARNIKKEAIHVIQRVMDAVSTGQPLETREAYQLIDKMEKSVSRNKDALVLLTQIRKKDEYTLMHSIGVGAHILNFCNFYRLPHEQTLSLAIGALFHDIGKTMVPLKILNKPGKLTDSEYEEMKKHAEFSARVMQNSKGLPGEAHDMGLHHHERFDGNGYPHKLKGDQITFASQLAAIADVYDAITSDRCYRDGMQRVEGLRKMYEWSEYHFNKELTYKFIRCIGVYPIGTCVRLESGRIAVVVGSTESMMQPVVRIFHDDQKQTSLPVHDFDLSKSSDRVIGYEPPAKWDLGKLNILGGVSR